MPLVGPRGLVTARALVRSADGGPPAIAVLPAVGESDVLAPSALRSICARLGFDPAEFGFGLDSAHDDDDDDDDSIHPC